MAGGPVPDPVTALARLLATLTDDHGDPSFDGCWDDWIPPSAADRARIAALGDPTDELRAVWGVRPGVTLAGDPATSILERLWCRPAVTVIGIDGHPIAGSSNQIVAEAAARVSVRVARGQDPHRINDALRDHLLRRVPFGLEASWEISEATPAWHCDPTGPAFDAAHTALRTAFGVEPVTMGVGATIPFVGPFAAAFGGIPTLLLGPADPGSRIHGEDESLDLTDWGHLIEAQTRLLALL